jgi:predicted nucleic acid-binding protein
MHRYIFVNTSAWLALYTPDDPNHEAARNLWNELRGESIRFVSTDYVMEQVYTALKVFGSLQAAQAVHQVFNSSHLIRFFMTDSVIFSRAWELFVADEQPQFTFTDCVNYAVIQYLGSTEVFTFDSNFTAPDLKILPAPPAG